MRYKKDFSLYRRASPKGKTVWYYRTYTEEGQRTVGRSTGKSSKDLAQRYCNKLLKEDRLIPGDNPVFKEYASTWWIWGKCDYLRDRLEHSDPSKPAVSERYANNMRRVLEHHLLPEFGELRLSAITAERIRKWTFQLRDQGMAGKGVNNVLSCLRIMLNEARRFRRVTTADPFKIVRPLGVNSQSPGVLTVAEVQRLFAEDNTETAWKGHRLFRCINLFAAATGCRQGELLALRDEDVHPDWLHIAASYNSTWGRGLTKTKEMRDLPIPSRVIATLRPFLGHGGYVFSVNGGKAPVNRIGVNEALYAALDAIGIPEAERQARHIVFHSWRGWLNTVLRARAVPDPLVRRITGHATVEMTERYSRFVREDFAPVLAVQEELLK